MGNLQSVGTRVAPWVKKALNNYADKHDQTQSEAAREAISMYLKGSNVELQDPPIEDYPPLARPFVLRLWKIYSTVLLIALPAQFVNAVLSKIAVVEVAYLLVGVLLIWYILLLLRLTDLEHIDASLRKRPNLYKFLAEYRSI